jgi:hypothetical protein
MPYTNNRHPLLRLTIIPSHPPANPTRGNFAHLVLLLLLLLLYLFLTAIGMTPGGSSTLHIYTETVHRKTENGT